MQRMVTNMGMTDNGNSVTEEVHTSHTTTMNEPTEAAPAKARRGLFGSSPGLVAFGLFAVAGTVAWYGGAIDALTKQYWPGAQGQESAAPAVVNVNAASAEELCKLPSVDEKIAAAIIAKRPFSTVEDILEVKGIGEKKLAKLRPLITVQ